MVAIDPVRQTKNTNAHNGKASQLWTRNQVLELDFFLAGGGLVIFAINASNQYEYELFLFNYS
jgi:hypothetical protein